MGTKRRRLLVAFAMVLVPGLIWLVCYLRRPPDPVYQGKTMSAWVKQEMQSGTGSIDSVGGALVSGAPMVTTYRTSNKTFAYLLNDRGPDILPYLIKALKARDSRLWEPYVWLRSHLPNFIGRRLPQWVEPRRVRQRVVMLIEGMGSVAKPAVPTLCEIMLHEQDDTTRLCAVNAINFIGTEATDAAPALLLVLEKDTTPEIRAAAAFDLIKIHTNAQDVVPALARALQDPQPRVRFWAARALEKYGKEAGVAVPALLLALEKDASPEIRAEAAVALGEIHADNIHVVPVLGRALQDGDYMVRFRAARALGEYGTSAVAAEEPLRRLAAPGTFSAGADVSAARAALKKIDPATAAQLPAK
jgi:HEAT repeat protein